MPQPLIWTDEYHGPRWRYGLSLRPPNWGGAPDGWIAGTWVERVPGFAHGAIEYPFELDPRTVSQASLVLVARFHECPFCYCAMPVEAEAAGLLTWTCQQCAWRITERQSEYRESRTPAA